MAATVTRDELIALLSVRMEDADLMELIDRADGAEHPEEVLRAAYDAILGPPPAPGDISSSGIKIVPVIINAVDPQTRQPTEVVAGYELSREENGSTLYCGLTLSWGPRYKSIPFRTIPDAENAIRVWMDLQADRQKRPPVISHKVTLFVAHGLEPKKLTTNFSVRLSADEAAKMEALLFGLRDKNFELATNTPIDSYPDVLRWILKQINLT